VYIYNICFHELVASESIELSSNTVAEIYLLHILTHTQTHTHTERERERERNILKFPTHIYMYLIFLTYSELISRLEDG